MNLAPEAIEIDYRIYEASDAAEMTTLLAEAFAHRDPLALAVGLTPPEFESFVRILLPTAAAQGLTIVARRRDTGEMVGALLTEDAASDAGEEMDGLGEKFRAVGSILGELVTAYRAGATPVVGDMLHLYLLGVSDRAVGTGVGKRLVATCVENGVRRGYRLAVAEATNKTSQHIFRKRGFAERAQISYRDHVFNGEHVFKCIEEHGGPILMEKMLRPES